MIIITVKPKYAIEVTTDEGIYRRYTSDYWTQVIGGSEETIPDCQKIEKLYLAYMRNR